MVYEDHNFTHILGGLRGPTLLIVRDTFLDDLGRLKQQGLRRPGIGPRNYGGPRNVGVLTHCGPSKYGLVGTHTQKKKKQRGEKRKQREVMKPITL